MQDTREDQTESFSQSNPWLKFARPALIVYWVSLAIATHIPEGELPSDPVFHFQSMSADKMIHFSAYVGLTVLLFASAVLGRCRGRTRNLIAAALIAAIYGGVDEYTQTLIGRTGTFPDFAADLAGALAVLGAGLLSPPWKVHRESNEKAHARSGRFVGHAMLVSAFTFLSRITGLLRDAVLAAAFGLRSVTDAFYLAFIIPNLFRRLFGEGALTAAFIPVYTELLKKDRAAAGRLATLCVSLLVILLGGITVVGELILAWMLRSYEWSADSGLALELTMVMLPYMPMVCLVAMIGGVLQVHGRFGPAAFAPILLNLFVIGATILGAWGFTHDEELRHVIFIAASAVVAAGVAQLVWVVAAVVSRSAFSPGIRGAGGAMKSVVIAMAPMVIGLAVFQINTLFDGLIAWFLSPKNGAEQIELFGRTMRAPIKTGGVTALQFAQRLYQFPVGVFGVAIATAIFPALARAAAPSAKPEDAISDADLFRTTVQHGLRLTVFIGLPASVGLIMVREPLIRLIFERGEFDAAGTVRVGWILIGYASAVWAYSMTHVVTRAFYALKDARTPLRVALVMVALNLAMNLTFVWPLGAAGLAWSTAICAAIQSAVLVRLLRRKVSDPVDATVLRGWRRSLLLSVVMGGALLPSNLLFDVPNMDNVSVVLLLAGQVIAGGGLFLLGAKFTKAEEIHWLRKREAAS